MKNYNPNSHHIPEKFQACMLDRTCGSCSARFTPTNMDQKYCGYSCKEREVRRRKRIKKRKRETQAAIMQYARMTGVI